MIALKPAMAYIVVISCYYLAIRKGKSGLVMYVEDKFKSSVREHLTYSEVEEPMGCLFGEL